MLYHTLGQYTTYLQARKLGVLSFEFSSETFQFVSEKHITRSIMSNYNKKRTTIRLTNRYSKKDGRSS